jgi:hypothetical protein
VQAVLLTKSCARGKADRPFGAARE